MVEQTEEKKRPGWVVPADSVEAMRNEEATLFKEAFLAMHDYNMGTEIDIGALSVGARILFNSFKKLMDSNVARYAKTVKRNQETAKTRKRAKKQGV